MSKIKSLLLGSAAGVLAATGVQAADLPQAEPVEYVRICDTYGSGFYYIPGTDTCLQVAGLVRFRIIGHATNTTNDTFAGSPFEIVDEDSPTQNDTFNMNYRGRLNIDARTETGMGTLRSFIRFQGTGTDIDNAVTELDLAFIQFAGFTVGLADAVGNFPDVETFSDVSGNGNFDSIVAIYTAEFGGGFSGSFGIQSNERQYTSFFETTNVSTFSSTTGIGVAYGEPTRTEYPDGVAELRVKQAWGEAEISGIVREIRTRVTNGTVAAGTFREDSEQEFGFAVQGGVKLDTNNLFGAPKGGSIVFKGNYADGATRSGGQFQPREAVITGFLPAGPGVSTIDLETAEVVSFYAGFTHFLIGTAGEAGSLRTNVAGGYTEGGSDVGDIGDFEAYNVAANLIYTPVKNLDVGIEGFYANTDIAAASGSGNVGNGYSNLPFGGEEDSFGAIFHVARSF